MRPRFLVPSDVRRGRVRRSGARSLGMVAALLLTVGLSACGSTAGDDAPPPSTAAAAPVTIEQKYGAVTVPANPTKVATVGYNDQDFVLALGVQPVLTRGWFDSYNTLPWVEQETDGKGVTEMKDGEIDYEALAAAQPDVILAIYETLDQPTYERLSKIAPTVLQPSQFPDEETPWDAQLLLTGKVLGKDQEAQALVTKVKGAIDKAKADNPGFAGKVLVVDYGPEDGGHYLIPKGDPRRALFDALGFAAQDAKGDVSQENLNLLDRDVLFVAGATKAQMAGSPGFDRLKVVQEDRTLYTTFDSPLGGALSYSGPSALLYAIDKVVPQLANAVGGKPVADLSNA
ncbi:iron-siderophore ABC transporter substrate-binding protein [Pseudonocardia benzenivorans]|nr:ABC transporter substrate-binding protein [Pseudonocardia sp. D17]